MYHGAELSARSGKAASVEYYVMLSANCEAIYTGRQFSTTTSHPSIIKHLVSSRIFWSTFSCLYESLPSPPVHSGSRNFRDLYYPTPPATTVIVAIDSQQSRLYSIPTYYGVN